MKDEIKILRPGQILDYVDTLEHLQELFNYITNLQEENEKLKEIVENLTTMTVCGDRIQIKNTAQYKLDIYKQRIDKAIEYIKNNKYKKMGGYGDNEDEDIEECLFEDDIWEIEKLLDLDNDELRGKETPRAIDYLIEDKINQVIDYLKSKGE